MKRQAAWNQAIIALLVILLFTACKAEEPTATPTIIKATETLIPSPTATRLPLDTPTPTPDWTGFPSTTAQIKITTSSSWTNLILTQGNWHSASVVSLSDQATIGTVDGNKIKLTQNADRAESGEQVEIVVDLSLVNLEPEGILKLEINQGDIGSTAVEISRIKDETTEFITTFGRDGTQPSGSKIPAYEVSAAGFLNPNPNEYVVIAQLNFWYYGPGIYGGFENGDGSRDTPLTPYLGYTYNQEDPAVVYQQIEWAVDYGVDAFSIEWTTPRGVGCCGSMERILDETFLKSPNLHKIRWAIFYDFILRLMQTDEIHGQFSFPVNFDQPVVYETFVNDFVHFAKKYFDHPQYLTIDGRPVIYVWASHSYLGDLAGAIKEARERVAELGYDVFIVGDEVCLGCYNAEHASQFDANTTFTFLIPGVDQYALKNVGEAAEAADYAFAWWRNRINGLKVAGREEEVNFQPGWAPQYDERYRDNDGGGDPQYVPAENKEQVIQMAEVARKHAEPVGTHDLKLIWVNTWNCWAETTTVEPTIDEGPKYPAGNYGFDMLEVIKEVFGGETYYTSPLR